MAEGAIQFLRRGKIVTHRANNPMQTVLDYLRLDEKSKGTKEGCNEGDCGACTVTLGSLKGGKLVYEPANACILLMGHLEGKELITVDDLASDNILHPVQQAMVECHGSQCGFCTPGIVMSLFALYHGNTPPTRASIENALAGNLCRCTGYRPIIDAAFKALHGRLEDQFGKRRSETLRQLQLLAARGDVFAGDGHSFIAIPKSKDALLNLVDEHKDARGDVFAGDGHSFIAIPKSEDALLNLVDEHKDATIVSGATDVGLWITKQLRVLPKLIFTHAVAPLHLIGEAVDSISIGAAATYAEAMETLAAIHPDVGEVVRRIGSAQVRSSGTIGGNIANGSPIGDMPPMLIALGATLLLKSVHGQRSMPLEDFFVAYGKQNRTAGEMVWRIDIPKLDKARKFSAYKISKRFDQDISAVMAAFRFQLHGRHIASARIACGGLAATPKRAPLAEAALGGLSLDNPPGWHPAIAAMAQDYQPISDMRASADYRLQVAQNLLRKALLEAAGKSTTTRVLELA